MGSADLVLKPACEGCGNTSDLYGTGCKHTTLCSDCGKSMARSRARCLVCSSPITRLIREYNVRANAITDKTYSIGRFVTGLPPFSKKSAENKWSLHKEGLQGRQIPDNMRPLLRSIRTSLLYVDRSGRNPSAPSRSAWPFSDVLTSATLPAPHSSPLLRSAQWHGLQNLHQQAMFMLLPSSLGYVYGVTSPHTLFAYASEGGNSMIEKGGTKDPSDDDAPLKPDVEKEMPLQLQDLRVCLVWLWS
ncbi:transcription initiation factor IIF subunit alpha isoform X2 [Panicum miliaceum]|uniref:Transcription initiation factor IIF subunit alpha isoform X2 n=1 Tax=Panicum miliaceum TaxID=4540 RepID=A0A3L6SFE7_PANMI|nr:transcription initiation factor IIF subunit alpha isoform X2 [Panicum miliaceum]